MRPNSRWAQSPHNYKRRLRIGELSAKTPHKTKKATDGVSIILFGEQVAN